MKRHHVIMGVVALLVVVALAANYYLW